MENADDNVFAVLKETDGDLLTKRLLKGSKLGKILRQADIMFNQGHPTDFTGTARGEDEQVIGVLAPNEKAIHASIMLRVEPFSGIEEYLSVLHALVRSRLKLSDECKIEIRTGFEVVQIVLDNDEQCYPAQRHPQERPPNAAERKL
ncbi:hypothetical protein ACFL0Z_03655 [Patescibacteria group bacterium]